ANDVAVFSADVAGGLGFTNSTGFDVGLVDVAAGTLTGTGANVVATGDVGLRAKTGDVRLVGDVNGADVLLMSDLGRVYETTGSIGAGALVVQASGDVLLNGTTNAV